jgi:hypothetical protein
MLKNSKQDFLETIKEPQIICPSCGSPMTLENKSTFDVILSVNSRKVMNDIIRSFRSFLERNENELKSTNLYGVHRKQLKSSYPFPKYDNEDEEGLINTGGAQTIEKYLSVPDILGVSKVNNSVITLEELNSILLKNGDDKKDQEKIETLIKSIVFGFEPHPLIGPVLNLIFDQDNIKNWVDSLKIGSKDEKDTENIKKIVRTTAPFYYGYLSRILDYINKSQKTSDSCKLFGKYAKPEDVLSIKNQAIRCIYAISIFMGHSENEREGEQNIIPFMEKNIPFDFPRLVVVSQPILSQLLKGRSIIENKGFNVSSKFKDLIFDTEQDFNDSTLVEKSIDVLKKDINDILEKHDFLKDDLNNFVEFACTGSPASIPEYVKIVDKKSSEQINGSSMPPQGNPPHSHTKESISKEKCGWYPKTEQTHPIVLIGSAGTGKSTVMMAGLTTFMNTAGSLGISPRPTTSKDVDLINWYSEQFFDGYLPKATETSSRFSVELTLVKTQDIENRINFIFTDIPGEMVARSLERKDTDPVMINLLKYAETIVFFFDIATEPYFFSVLNKGKKQESWEHLLEDVRGLREQGRGKTNQILLLNKLIEDLRKLRGNDKEIKDNVRLICVIPKSDFFSGVSSDKTKFLNSFYDEMNKKKIIDSSQLSEEGEDNNVLHLRSVGGVNFDTKTIDLIERQLEIIELISSKAKESLLKIEDALGQKEDGVSESDKKVLKNKISVELIDVINNTFKKDEVYVIPVSAQGKSVKSGNRNENTQLPHPPSQKLAEYVFITPIALELKKQSDEKKKKGDGEKKKQ